jgi:hypothetical protein
VEQRTSLSERVIEGSKPQRGHGVTEPPCDEALVPRAADLAPPRVTAYPRPRRGSGWLTAKVEPAAGERLFFLHYPQPFVNPKFLLNWNISIIGHRLQNRNAVFYSLITTEQCSNYLLKWEAGVSMRIICAAERLHRTVTPFHIPLQPLALHPLQTFPAHHYPN